MGRQSSSPKNEKKELSSLFGCLVRNLIFFLIVPCLKISNKIPRLFSPQNPQNLTAEIDQNVDTRSTQPNQMQNEI